MSFENRDAWRAVLVIALVGIATCVLALLALAFSVRAGGPEPAPAPGPSAVDSAIYWEKIKSAALSGGRTGVNCCGPADGVRVEILPEESPRDILHVRIIDMMRSRNGYPGAIISISRDLLVTNVWNPYPFPIAFIRRDLTPICLSGVDGR